MNEQEYFKEVARLVDWNINKNKNLANRGYAIFSKPYTPESVANPIYVLEFDNITFQNITVNNKLKQKYVVEHVNAPTGLKLTTDEQKDALSTLMSRIEDAPKRVLPITEQTEAEIAQTDLKGLKPKKA